MPFFHEMLRNVYIFYFLNKLYNFFHILQSLCFLLPPFFWSHSLNRRECQKKAGNACKEKLKAQILIYHTVSKMLKLVRITDGFQVIIKAVWAHVIYALRGRYYDC